ncbi:MAG: hypothetical protein EXS29_02090 [Pedosphaera sp.]|nr:hypothetical protein [Pedosphaera sp.]MST00088.1 hypothetical protein [Pedosphaera sp.]
MKHIYTTITVILFALLSFVHLLRLVLGWDLSIAGTVIPMWASVLGGLISGGLALMLWRETHHIETHA